MSDNLMLKELIKSKVQSGFSDKKLILHYVRDKQGNPVGVVAGTRNGVGFAFRNKTDKYDKNFGILTAWDRAERSKSGFYSDEPGARVPGEYREQLYDIESRVNHRRIKYFHVS
jgi:hypothetical protein